MNVYQKVTDAIISRLQQGEIPWQKNYVGGRSVPVNYVTRKPYQGVNRFLLTRGGEYLTFNQIQQLGGHIKPGSKAEFAIFFKRVEKTAVIDGEEVDAGFPLLRYYNLFHLEDVEGIESKLESEPLPCGAHTVDSIEDVVSSYTSREGIEVEHSACTTPLYQPLTDKVVLPTLEQYRSTEGYYGSYLHELVHSTGTQGRLARGIESNASGSEAYAREELVAEIGRAMAASELGIDNGSTVENNVAYIQSWIKSLQNDVHMVVWAASRAEKAVDFILHGRQDNNSQEPAAQVA